MMDSTWLEEWKEDAKELGPVVTFEEYEDRFGVHPHDDDQERDLDGVLLTPGMASVDEWERELQGEGV